MAKGNRIVNQFLDNVWLDVFYDSVGTYVNVINKDLSEIYKPEPLSKYIKIGGGYAFKTAQYKKEGIPVIRISDFNNERIDISNCIFYDEDDSLSKYKLKEGDIIICLTGGTIGKLGIVQAGLGKLYLNQRVGRFDVLDENIFEKEYVYWIARSVQDTIKKLAWGAAIPNVSPKQIEQLKFSIPNIDEQRAIIEFLNDLKSDSIQDKEYFNHQIENHIIELHQTNINLKLATKEITHQLDVIKNLRQAFLREAMQGLLVSNETSNNKTGVDLLTEIQAEKAQLVKEKKIKKPKPLVPITEQEIPFNIPDGVKFVRLEDIATVEKGKIGIQKAVKGEFPLVVTGENRLSCNEFHFEGSAVIVPLVSSTGHGHASLKRIHYQEGKYAVGNILGVIQTFLPNYFNTRFLFNYLDTYKESFFVEKMKGAANVSLKLSSILETPIPIINIESQNKYEELMDSCDALEEQVKQSQQTNELLLQQVLREALGDKKAKAINTKIGVSINKYVEVETNYDALVAETFGEYLPKKVNNINDTNKELAALVYLMNNGLGANYGNVAFQKAVFNSSFITPNLYSKKHDFVNHNFGTYSKELANDLNHNPYLTTIKIGTKEVYEIEPSKKNEILNVLSSAENKNFVSSVNKLIDLYRLPFINKETNKMELLNTILKIYSDLKTIDIEIIYQAMKDWKIKQTGFNTKAEKFSKEDTAMMIELLVRNNVL